MRYVIYPDLLFVENILCNLLFLSFLKGLFFPASTWKKIFKGSFITACCNTLVSVLFFHSIWLLKIGAMMPASGLMICYCMDVRDKRRILYLMYQMTVWTFAYAGFTQMLGEKIVLSMTVFVICFGILEKIMKIYRRQNECIREVTLCFAGKCQCIKGFADTGNHLVDPVTQKPVSVITNDLWEKMMQDTQKTLMRSIPYASIGNPNGLIHVVQIDYMAILQGKDSQIIEKPVIAITNQPFSGSFHYSILLHSDFC